MKLNNKKSEINDLTNEIKSIQNACQKILTNINENENKIKWIDLDKNYILKNNINNR